MTVQCDKCLDILDGFFNTACKCNNLEVYANETRGDVDVYEKEKGTAIYLSDFGQLTDEINLSDPLEDW